MEWWIEIVYVWETARERARHRAVAIERVGGIEREKVEKNNEMKLLQWESVAIAVAAAITTDAAAAKYVMGRMKTTWSRESMTRWFECVINYFAGIKCDNSNNNNNNNKMMPHTNLYNNNYSK